MRVIYSEPLHVLMAVVALVLLIACANVATLLLARGSARSRELFVRLALGASRSRLVRQLVTENLAFALLGGAAGIALAWWGVKILASMVQINSVVNVNPDLLVLCVTLGISVLTGIGFGLIPALRSSRTAGMTSTFGRSSNFGMSKSNPAHALVVLQVALSCVVLVGAGLLAHSLLNLENQDLGFKRDNLLLVRTDARLAGYQPAALLPLYQQLQERLNALPGVLSAAIAQYSPISSTDNSSRLSYRDYVDFRDRSRSFEGLVAFTNLTFSFSSRPNALPQRKMGMLVTGNFFRALGIEPELGRGFRPEEDQAPDRDAVLVLSHDLWQQEFASDPAIVGRKVRLSGIDFTVVGVAPDRFTGMDQYVHPTLYIPIMMSPRINNDPNDHLIDARGQRDLLVKGRLKPGVTLDQARAELQVIATNLARSYPDTNRNVSAAVSTEMQARIDDDPVDAQMIGMVAALAAAVLLMACANVALLLLSRARARSREIALRLAIGAGRARLIRQLLTESLVLALAGEVCGIAVAYAGVLFFSRIEIPSDLPIKLTVQLDQRALWVSLAVSLASAVLFGLAPALQITRPNLVNALKTAGADAPGRKRLFGRNLLVVGQVAASMVLLLVAATLFQTFHAAQVQGPGYRTDHLLMMSFNPSLVRYSDAQAQWFFRQIAERARSAAGVKSAALAFNIPMGIERDRVTIVPEGYQFPQGQQSVDAMSDTVDENYFDTLAVPIVRGRPFLATDTASAPRVAIVNEALAKHYWPGQDPVGKRFRLDDRNGPWVQIVGVTKTGKYEWFAEPPTEFVYLPLAQHPRSQVTLLAQSFGNPAALVAPLRDVVRSIDANQPIYDVRTMEDYFQNRAVKNPNMIVQTVGAMGLIGLILALVGLYGLVAYTASRRTREIGIRMAIGAQRGSVLRMVMHQGLRLAVIGIVVGLALSLGAARVLNAIFSGSGADWPVYLLVAPALLAITLLAAYIPARRASRVDPTTALRYD
jgi:predicted permease